MARFALLIVLTTLGVTPCLAQGASDTPPPNVARAFAAAITRNQLYGLLPARCVSYAVQENTPARIEVDTHSIPGHGCPGNPETSPKLGSLAYDKATGKVMYYDFPSEKFLPVPR